ncbi:MAG: DinB family protein [Tepidiformaceae bacterium]
MVSEFEAERERTVAELRAARAGLIDLVSGLSDSDLGRGRRGQWTIAGVLDHVLESDLQYARLILALRGQERPGQSLDPTDTASVAAAAKALATTRDLILRAADGVDEETFYRLGGGHQQYSVLSTLENVTLHDHEHGAQIQQVMAGVPPAT